MKKNTTKLKYLPKSFSIISVKNIRFLGSTKPDSLVSKLMMFEKWTLHCIVVLFLKLAWGTFKVRDFNNSSSAQCAKMRKKGPFWQHEHNSLRLKSTSFEIVSSRPNCSKQGYVQSEEIISKTLILVILGKMYFFLLFKSLCNSLVSSWRPSWLRSWGAVGKSFGRDLLQGGESYFSPSKK